MHSCHVSNDDDSGLLFIAPEEAYSLPAHSRPKYSWQRAMEQGSTASVHRAEGHVTLQTGSWGWCAVQKQEQARPDSSHSS